MKLQKEYMADATWLLEPGVVWVRMHNYEVSPGQLYPHFTSYRLTNSEFELLINEGEITV